MPYTGLGGNKKCDACHRIPTCNMHSCNVAICNIVYGKGMYIINVDKVTYVMY